MGAPKSNKCALVREHIRANPGCTYQHIAAGIGIASNHWLKDVRKMVARGMVLCEEREGVRYHTIGREPTKVFGLTREEHAERKRLQRDRYAKSPEGREKRNARRRKGPAVKHKSAAPRCWSINPRIADHTLGKLAAPAKPELVRGQTVEDFLASGGVIERLPSRQEAPAYGRNAA